MICSERCLTSRSSDWGGCETEDHTHGLRELLRSRWRRYSSNFWAFFCSGSYECCNCPNIRCSRLSWTKCRKPPSLLYCTFMLMSPITLRASFKLWYIFNIVSRLSASSGDSSIKLVCRRKKKSHDLKIEAKWWILYAKTCFLCHLRNTTVLRDTYEREISNKNTFAVSRDSPRFRSNKVEQELRFRWIPLSEEKCQKLLLKFKKHPGLK